MPVGERPRRADARRNHEAILEAAREVFSREGVSAPIDAVAARAGVGVGTLYRHFATKDSLFEAIMVSRMQLLTEEARALIGGTDPGAAFYAFLTSMADQGASDMALACAVADAGIDLGSAHHDLKRPLLAAVADLLARAQAAGAVREDVSVDDVLALFSATCLDADRRPRDAASASCMRRIVFDGLRPHRELGGRAHAQRGSSI
ncbi:MAG TPA: helix-turn-helix domain-containing protein [Gaiellales bacterium]|nr:helix-turn-helix domain-containing protein [Gaiellales bacterium]